MINYVITKKNAEELFVISVDGNRSGVTFSTPEGREITVGIEDLVSTFLKVFPMARLQNTFDEYRKFVAGYRIYDSALQAAVRLSPGTFRTMRVGRSVMCKNMGEVIIRNGLTIPFEEAAHIVMASIIMRKLEGVESLEDITSYEYTIDGSYCELWEEDQIQREEGGWYRIF